MAFQVTEGNECTELKKAGKRTQSEKKTKKEAKTQVKWVGEPRKEGNKKLFSTALVHGTEVCQWMVLGGA